MKLSRLFRGTGFALLAGSLGWCQSYTISTYAGGVPPPTPAPGVSASIGKPGGISTDAAGNVYFTSDNCVFRLDQNGVLTRIGGNSRRGYSGDGGLATAAQFDLGSSLNKAPAGVAVDGSGNVYIADSGNGRIGRISPAGIITTIRSQLGQPAGVAVDSVGNLYIADTNSNRILRITPAGIVSVIAGGSFGYSGDGGPAVSATLSGPYGVAIDNAGNLYIADLGNNCIRKVTPAGIISTVAGNGIYGYSGDGGQATSAQLRNPTGVAVDSVGNLYMADSDNNRIRKVTPAGIISTVAGNGISGFSGDGSQAMGAQLAYPFGVAVDGAGNLYIADLGNLRVREVTTAGVMRTVAGDGTLSYSGDGGQAGSAQLGTPNGVALDSAGDIYIADTGNSRIRKITPSGVIRTLAGTGHQDPPAMEVQLIMRNLITLVRSHWTVREMYM